MISVEDGCVVLRVGEQPELYELYGDERVVLTRGQAVVLADVISPYSLIFAQQLRAAAEGTVGSNLSNREESLSDD